MPNICPKIKFIDMKIENCPNIPDIKIISLNIHSDSRGFFVERYNESFFSQFNLPTNYFQDNHSLSYPNVIRGLHYQQNPSQAKFVGCLSGKIWDVAVDIRKNSKTFGQYFAIELSPDNGKMLFIPYGFAHGFCVIGNEPANVMYKVDNQYSKEGDGGIKFDDTDLNIKWPVTTPIVSDKDRTLPSLQQYLGSNNTF